MEQIPRTIKNFLKELGCNNTEIIVINQLLNESGQTLRQIARATEKSTGVLSEALKKLIAKGIIKREIVNSSPCYLIDNPETIVRWAHRKSDRNIQVLKQKQKDFERFSKTLVSNSVKPKIRFFTGIEGLRESYQEIIDHNPKEILSHISLAEGYPKEIFDILDNFVKQRIKNNISVRIIARKSPMAMYLKLHDKEKLRETRLVSEKGFPTVNSEINLFGNFMHSMSIDPKGIFAFILEDKHMVNIHKASFEFAWKESKRESEIIEKEIGKVKDPKILIKEIEELRG